MLHSTCLCLPEADFREHIVYKNETVFRRFEGTIIAKCTHCGLLKTFPPSSSRRFDPAQSRGDMYDQESDKFVSLFAPIVGVVKREMTHGTVLDVGCSSGLLLSLIKKEGYEAYGIEPNTDAFKKAQQKLGTNIYHGTMKEFLKNNRTFDCIIYNHVLEHITDVNAELKLISKALKPGGILIAGVPNTANVIFFMRGKYWEPLMPNEHIWHFSAYYLERLLRKHGLSVFDKTYSDDPRKDYPLRKRLYFKTLSLVNMICGTGEAVLLVARKIV